MTRHVACLTILLTAAAPCLADDPPDAEVNPQTGYIETVATVSDGPDHGIQLTIDRGSLPPLTEEVATGSTDDLGPRLAIDSSGKVSVVWTRDGSSQQVWVRARTSSWGADRLVSDASENSRNPEIAQDGATTWVVYEIDGASSNSVAVSIIGDEPDPIGTRKIVATGAWTGDVDARIHAEDGHVWVTWVADGSELGWSELEGGESWSSPAYQTFSGSDVDAARAEVREVVLGL